MKIRYLHERRNGIRFYRRVIPADVRAKIGKASKVGGRPERQWERTFRASTPLAVVLREVEVLARQHDALIRQARGEELTPAEIEDIETGARGILAGDRVRRYQLQEWLASELDSDVRSPYAAAMAGALDQGGRVQAPTLKLSEALVDDARLAGHGDKQATVAVDQFIADIGRDPALAEITHGMVAEHLKVLSDKGLKPGTVKRRLGALAGLWRRSARRAGLEGQSPFHDHRIMKGGNRADTRLPLSRPMLNLLESYLAMGRARPETRSLLIIMQHTGLGVSEAGGLAVDDIVTDAQIPFLHVRPNSIRGLKTESRVRRVPLVGPALQAAVEAVQRARSKRRKELFGAFNANSLSARLTKAMRTAGIPKSNRLSPYSLRHTMLEALRAAGTPDHISRRLAGHSSGDVHSRYGSPAALLASKHAALLAALPFLGEVDPSIFSASERLPD